MKFEIHPLCAVLRGEDFGHDTDESAALESSVIDYGPVSGRIVVDADTSQVLDGWSFKCAWEAAARDNPDLAQRYPIDRYVEVREFADETEKAMFVLAMQCGRRNLKTAQRLAAIDSIHATINGFSWKTNVESIDKFRSRALSRCGGVSGSMVKLWNRIRKRGEPGLQQAAAAGAVSAKDAAEVAALGASEQREAINAGAEGIKAKAEEVRQERSGKPKESGSPGRPRKTSGAPSAAPAASASGPELTAAWWNAKNRSAEERGNVLRAAGLNDVLEAAWRSQKDDARKSFVANHAAELRAIWSAITTRGADTKPFDRTAAINGIAKLRRDMPRNAHVEAVCALFEKAIGSGRL